MMVDGKTMLLNHGPPLTSSFGVFDLRVPFTRRVEEDSVLRLGPPPCPFLEPRDNGKGSPYVHRSVQHTQAKLVVLSIGWVRSQIYPEGIVRWRARPMKKTSNLVICLLLLVHILFQSWLFP